jgi:hypothetical protein
MLLQSAPPRLFVAPPSSAVRALRTAFPAFARYRLRRRISRGGSFLALIIAGYLSGRYGQYSLL